MRDNRDTELNAIPMSTPDLIEIQANALALAVLIQAQAESKDDVDTLQKRYYAQPITGMTKGQLKEMIEKRVDYHMEGHLYRIDRLEKTVESYGVRIAQLEANQKPPKLN